MLTFLFLKVWFDSYWNLPDNFVKILVACYCLKTLHITESISYIFYLLYFRIILKLKLSGHWFFFFSFFFVLLNSLIAVDSLVAKTCLRCGRPRFDPWVGKIPWRRKWQPTPVCLPRKFHGWRSLVGSSPWGHKESDKAERLHSLTHL